MISLDRLLKAKDKVIRVQEETEDEAEKVLYYLILEAINNRLLGVSEGPF